MSRFWYPDPVLIHSSVVGILINKPKKPQRRPRGNKKAQKAYNGHKNFETFDIPFKIISFTKYV